MKTKRLFAVVLIATLGNGHIYAKQHALVVGIDHYPNLLEDKHLKGAVNDAKLLRDNLRAKGVELPDRRVLLNEAATVESFKQAYQDLLSNAESGDELIITFAGHGHQEVEFSNPRDEKDGKDETLVFSNYKDDTLDGRISDDELYSMLAEAQRFSVLFVADTCHSGGISRSPAVASELRKRGGLLNNYSPTVPSNYVEPIKSDAEPLAHVTYLMAADKDELEISEYPINGQNHGALSVSFANAIKGYADQDKNKVITRSELIQFVQKEVKKLSDHKQIPDLLPRGDSNLAFSLAKIETPLEALPNSNLAIKVEGAGIPAGVSAAHQDSEHYVLRFIVNDNRVKAYNPQGDELTQFDYLDLYAWNRLLAKHRLLAALDTYERGNQFVTIKLAQGDDAHKLEEHLDFKINFASTDPYFYLFNLASTGEWQSLYPRLSGEKSKLTGSYFPLELKVTLPTGRDDVVALACERENTSLKKLIEQQDGKEAPVPEAFLASLGKYCHVGRYAFFSVAE